MKPVLVFDTEVYRDYFLVAFRNQATGNVVHFERLPDQAIDAAKVQRILAAYTVVSFNGNHFDLPVLAMALTGAECSKIKDVADAIIVGKKKYWEIYREYGLTQFEIDHIDLIEVAPGQVGLKQYGGRLHAPTLQDLPIEPGACIAPEQRASLRAYCANDLALTEQLYRQLLPQIELRARMTREYGIDLRSKSDAQIAEAVIKQEVEARTGTKLRRAELPPDTRLTYTPPAWIEFTSRPLREIYDVVREGDYRIDPLGSPLMPETMLDATVTIGASVYRLGIGGLHSSETRAVHFADDGHILVDRDVASYYPNIILRCGLAPANMGAHFLAVYRGIVERRLAAKRAGDKVTADALKICVNGSFGKLGSKWSVLYAPALFLQVTLTGQLALLMLIERLEVHGIPVVSANTDGVVIKCPVEKIAEMDAIVHWWEHVTEFETEATAYQFRSDLARILKRFGKTARHLDHDPQTLRDWNAGKIPILVAHPASAGHGLSLQDGGHILAYFSSGWNLEEDQQILERIGPTRQAQSGLNREVYVHRIVARDTVDELIQIRLKTKRSVQEILLEAMKK